MKYSLKHPPVTFLAKEKPQRSQRILLQANKSLSHNAIGESCIRFEVEKITIMSLMQPIIMMIYKKNPKYYC